MQHKLVLQICLQIRHVMSIQVLLFNFSQFPRNLYLNIPAFLSIPRIRLLDEFVFHSNESETIHRNLQCSQLLTTNLLDKIYIFLDEKMWGNLRKIIPSGNQPLVYIVCEECPRPKTRQKDDKDLTNSQVYFSYLFFI